MYVCAHIVFLFVTDGEAAVDKKESSDVSK